MGCCASGDVKAQAQGPGLPRVNSNTLLGNVTPGQVVPGKQKPILQVKGSVLPEGKNGAMDEVLEEHQRSGKRRVTFGTVATREYHVQISRSASF
mmetsp:Transcript_24816/g.56413  ORF Transcript_24816/g.56413 Transcript_24816/m.56413 type:complete len:95 (+) Transcript_24816:76-360(+)